MLPCNYVIALVMLIELMRKPLLLKSSSTNIKGQWRPSLLKVQVFRSKGAVRIGMSSKDGRMSISIGISKISSSRLARMIRAASLGFPSSIISNTSCAIKMIVLYICSKVLFRISLKRGESWTIMRFPNISMMIFSNMQEIKIVLHIDGNTMNNLGL